MYDYCNFIQAYWIVPLFQSNSSAASEASDSAHEQAIESTNELTKQSSSSRVGLESIGISLNLSRLDLEGAGYQRNATLWTEKEDQRLKLLRDDQGLDWDQIALRIPNRSAKMCCGRYKRLNDRTKQPWLQKDDLLLVQLFEKLGPEWKQIQKFFERRTHKQLKERYLSHLQPGITKEQWNLEEDLKLVQLLAKYGKNWKQIANFMPGRNEKQLKNRYYGRLKRLSERKSLGKRGMSSE